MSEDVASSLTGLMDFFNSPGFRAHGWSAVLYTWKPEPWLTVYMPSGSHVSVSWDSTSWCVDRGGEIYRLESLDSCKKLIQKKNAEETREMNFE